MKFVPIERDELPVSGRPSSKSATLFKDFLDSGLEVVEIELDADDKTPESVRSSLDNYVQRHDLPISVFTRAGRLFISTSDTKPSEREKKPRKARATAETNGTEPEVGTVDVGEGVTEVPFETEAEYSGV